MGNITHGLLTVPNVLPHSMHIVHLGINIRFCFFRFLFCVLLACCIRLPEKGMVTWLVVNIIVAAGIIHRQYIQSTAKIPTPTLRYHQQLNTINVFPPFNVMHLVRCALPKTKELSSVNEAIGRDRLELESIKNMLFDYSLCCIVFSLSH